MQKDKHISTRLSPELADIFTEFCQLRGEHVSAVLRRLILTELAEHSFLDAKAERALGVCKR